MIKSSFLQYPEYTDAYLRLAAIAKARNDIQSSITLVCNVLYIALHYCFSKQHHDKLFHFLQIADALKIDDKCPNALTMLGTLELKNDDWVKAKETFRAAKDATDGKDSYSTLALVYFSLFSM